MISLAEVSVFTPPQGAVIFACWPSRMRRLQEGPRACGSSGAARVEVTTWKSPRARTAMLQLAHTASARDHPQGARTHNLSRANTLPLLPAPLTSPPRPFSLPPTPSTHVAHGSTDPPHAHTRRAGCTPTATATGARRQSARRGRAAQGQAPHAHLGHRADGHGCRRRRRALCPRPTASATQSPSLSASRLPWSTS